MELFYKSNKKYNLNDFKVKIKNVQIIDLNLDEYNIQRKADKLKYFKEPKLTAYPLNLNEGYENYRFRKIDVIYGNTLSKVIKLDIEQNLSISNSHCNENDFFDVFTHRQAIINIIKTKFPENNSKFLDWMLYVTKFGNNLYMFSENDDNREESDACKRQTYHYKLEQLLFSDSPHNDPKKDEPVDENIRLNGTFRCQLGNFNLIYSAEIQGIISDEEIKDLNNLEMLNKCRFVNSKVTNLYKYKNQSIEIQKYFQNRLVDVDVTYYAFIDNNGYVHKPIKPIKTSDMCTGKSWNPKEYEQYVYDFLSLIVEKMSRVNSLETTYEFKYCSKKNAVYYKIHEGRTNKTFLADDYIKLMKQRNKF